MRRLSALLLFCLLVPATYAQSGATAFVGATVYPVSRAPIVDGVVVVENGRIVAVGARSEVAIPAGAQTVDVTGKTIVPGLVDSHSHVGSGDGGDASAALHPDVRILDAIDARSPTLERARAGGITTVNVMPGSGHLMSGQTVYLKLRDGNTMEDLLLICKDPLTEICGGMKMANGTNALRGSGGTFPGTRARSAAMARELFLNAQQYREKKQAAGSDTSKAPARDLKMEALLEVLDGRRTVHFHTHRHDDVLTALRLGREFGFTPVLHHVSEAWKIADEIAAAGAKASIIMLDAPGGKLEAVDIRYENGAVLERAGVDVAYHTDDYITDSRLFIRSGALGVRAGMSEAKALEALTLAGARMLGVEDRVGSLEKGKDADLVIMSGPPFSVYSLIEQTWVEGQKVFDRATSADHDFAVGGYRVYDAMHNHLHGEGE